MATLKETIDAELAKKQLTDLVEPKPEGNAPKKPTVEQINQVIVLLKNIEQSNGYTGIAHQVGITISEVKLIHERMKSRITELTPVEPDPEII